MCFVFLGYGEKKSGGPPKSPKKKRNRLSVINKFDVSTENALRKVVYKFYFKNEISTLDKILDILTEVSDFSSISRSTLYKALKEVETVF